VSTSKFNLITKGTKMLTIDQIFDLLQDRAVPVVAERTGIHYNTVLNIKNGTNKNPSYEVIKKLSDYFQS
jgi:transcriptional regulator with XRE-family HTH domain